MQKTENHRIHIFTKVVENVLSLELILQVTAYFLICIKCAQFFGYNSNGLRTCGVFILKFKIEICIYIYIYIYVYIFFSRC